MEDEEVMNGHFTTLTYSLIRDENYLEAAKILEVGAIKVHFKL
jgi:hypothetical protein